jgi:plasmid stability protein
MIGGGVGVFLASGRGRWGLACWVSMACEAQMSVQGSAPVRTLWRQNGATVRDMPSVQIKSVPEDVHAELRRRAANEGKSLQEYLLGRLVEEARRPSLDDLLSRAGQRSGGHVSFRFASEAVREDRDAG